MNSNKSIFFFILVILLICKTHSQNTSIERVEPPNWWIGMENTELQLLVNGKDISKAKPTINYDGVYLKSTTILDSPNYLFINLDVSKSAKPGIFKIEFEFDENNTISVDYELKSKKQKDYSKPTISSSDVMYLITPDRFSNGDLSNDSSKFTVEKVDRSNPSGRHGGDLKGIINHLDYIEDLGVTALWLNPILENNQPKYSYHGYAISNYYKTDPRFGTNEDFKLLIDKCHSKGMKMIMDQVFNHCGSSHWWMSDLPSEDWLNQWDKFTYSNFTNIAVSDPYTSTVDYELHTKGWFDTNMPDLNQENPFLATYLIQNSIWWIEYANIDGIRMDTYPYPDKDFMANWVKRVQKEYPNFYIVAETSSGEQVAAYTYWNNVGKNKDDYNSYIKSISDYALYYYILKAFGSENDIHRLYEILTYDYVYKNPSNFKIFNGNHDKPRLYSELNKSIDKVKLSMAFLFTTRGIPQIYYGDELLYEGEMQVGDGKWRKDFIGGWESDQRNAFNRAERTKEENELIDYMSNILNWRKNAVEIHKGSLKHYKPLNNVYVYFRTFKNIKTMVILNNNINQAKELNLERFKESLIGYKNGIDVISNKTYNLLNGKIEIEPNTALILKLND